MSYSFFMLAKETGIHIKEDTNMIVVFDLLTNLESYIKIENEKYNKN